MNRVVFALTLILLAFPIPVQAETSFGRDTDLIESKFGFISSLDRFDSFSLDQADLLIMVDIWKPALVNRSSFSSLELSSLPSNRIWSQLDSDWYALERINIIRPPDFKEPFQQGQLQTYDIPRMQPITMYDTPSIRMPQEFNAGDNWLDQSPGMSQDELRRRTAQAQPFINSRYRQLDISDPEEVYRFYVSNIAVAYNEISNAIPVGNKAASLVFGAYAPEAEEFLRQYGALEPYESAKVFNENVSEPVGWLKTIVNLSSDARTGSFKTLVPLALDHSLNSQVKETSSFNVELWPNLNRIPILPDNTTITNSYSSWKTQVKPGGETYSSGYEMYDIQGAFGKVAFGGSFSDYIPPAESYNAHDSWSDSSNNAYSSLQQPNYYTYESMSLPTNNAYDSWSEPSNSAYDSWSQPSSSVYDSWSEPSSSVYDSWSEPSSSVYDSWSQPMDISSDYWMEPLDISIDYGLQPSYNTYDHWSQPTYNTYDYWAQPSYSTYDYWSQPSYNTYDFSPPPVFKPIQPYRWDKNY